MEQNRDELEIDLRELFGVLWSKKIVIVLSGITVALIAVVVSIFLLTEKYQTQTTMYVLNQQNSDSVTYSDLQSGTLLANDYKGFITSRTVLDKVITELDLDETTDSLAKKISASIGSDSRVITITVTHEDPILATDIANAVREASVAHITDVTSVSSEDGTAENSVTVNTSDEAIVPTSPSTPNVKKNGLIGGVLGVALAIFIVLLVYILDDTIKTPDDVEKYLGVGVLGSIPLMEDAKGKRRVNRRKG